MTQCADCSAHWDVRKPLQSARAGEAYLRINNEAKQAGGDEISHNHSVNIKADVGAEAALSE
jgi:hypothetical protein